MFLKVFLLSLFLNELITELVGIPGYINKCIQLYETTVVRHGLMLVGPSGSGKTKVSHFHVVLVFNVFVLLYLNKHCAF